MGWRGETDEGYLDWLAEEKAAAAREARENDPVFLRCKVVEYKSTSSGRGRTPRAPRHVQLLVVDNTFAFVVRDGEVKPRKTKTWHSQPDELAYEIMTDLPEDERTSEMLLMRAMGMMGIR